MKYYPDDFEFYNAQENLNDSLSKIRRQIYKIFKYALKNKYEYFHINLEEYFYSDKKIILEEISNRFPYIGYNEKSQTMYDKIFSVSYSDNSNPILDNYKRLDVNNINDNVAKYIVILTNNCAKRLNYT